MLWCLHHANPVVLLLLLMMMMMLITAQLVYS